MNLVGKILTVLILVMSWLFLAFAVSVYATHKNWKDVVMAEGTGLVPKLKDVRQRNEELKDQRDTMERNMIAEQTTGDQVRAKLETELGQKSAQLTGALKNEAQLAQSTREAVAAMNATQLRLAEIRDQVKILQTDIDQAQLARDASRKEAAKLTTQLHEAVNELTVLNETKMKLVIDLDKAKQVLQKHGLKPEPELYAGVPTGDPEGVVLTVQGTGLVEISIGADDGLLKKHKLYVRRNRGSTNIYVATIEVLETYPDKAVCKIIPETRQGPMQKGDDVFSRL